MLDARSDGKSQSALPAAYFAANRRNLLDNLGDASLVILTAGWPPHRTADEDYPFFAQRNFFYLCGIEQEHAVLLLYRKAGIRREVLFISPKDAQYERWHGHLLDREQAVSLSGIADIQFLGSFEGILADLLADADLRLWLDQGAHNSQDTDLRSLLAEKWPGREPEDVSRFLVQMRMIKQAAEIDRLGLAIQMTGRGIDAMIRRLEPGLMEYRLWSEFNRTLADEGCLNPAFATIVASGANVFCLHYMKPFSQIKDGELVQVDVGATVGGLCADISRVFPAGGRFSADQLAIYELVRRCQETAFAAIRPGATLALINEACRRVAREGLLAAGIMREDEAVTDYFWHNVSHHLGLDVHDVANREALLQPGMVLTVEPGIYVPSIGIGMRLEDDVLVTESGCVNLSAEIPREAAEIERLMAEAAVVRQAALHPEE